MPKARTAPSLIRKERKGRSRLISRAIHGGIQANVTNNFVSFCTEPQDQTSSVRIDRRARAPAKVNTAKERGKLWVQMAGRWSERGFASVG